MKVIFLVTSSSCDVHRRDGQRGRAEPRPEQVDYSQVMLLTPRADQHGNSRNPVGGLNTIDRWSRERCFPRRRTRRIHGTRCKWLMSSLSHLSQRVCWQVTIIRWCYCSSSRTRSCTSGRWFHQRTRRCSHVPKERMRKLKSWVFLFSADAFVKNHRQFFTLCFCVQCRNVDCIIRSFLTSIRLSIIRFSYWFILAFS